MASAAGWYPDPQDSRLERYYNGRAWTHHTRNDLPDIPLAPWATQSQVVAAPSDTRPPRSGPTTALAVGVAVAGITTLTVVGVWASASALDETQLTAGGSDPTSQVFTCTDVQAETQTLVNAQQDPDITGWAGTPVTLTDNQPITSLPSGSAMEILIECENTAVFADGSSQELEMALTVDAAGQLYIDVVAKQ